jgi:predicted RNase H-like HicB family nuclease
MKDEYTIIIRKTENTNIALCIELNLCSTGDSLSEVNKNIREAIDVYLEDIMISPNTITESISINDFIEFLRDTEPENQEGYSNDPIKFYEIKILKQE